MKLNKGLSDNLKAAFPDIVPYIRPDLGGGSIKKKYLIRSGWLDLYLVKGVFMWGVLKRTLLIK